MPVTPSSPRLAYAIHGTTGPPVLLIMGLGMRGLVWRPQIDDLGRDHRLVSFDHRGIGDSEDAPGPFTMRDLAEDALRLFDGMGWDSAHVVGVSMGGMVAQELALMAPGRLRSLTLIATHAGGPTAWVPPIAGLRGFVAASVLSDEQRFGALASVLYPQDFLRVVDRDTLLARMRDQVGARTSARTRNLQIRAVMQHDTRARLAGLDVPTLLVTAGRDALVSPRQQRALVAAMPAAKHVSFDRAGHGVIFQCARVLNGHLRRHVRQHEPLLPHVRVHA